MTLKSSGLWCDLCDRPLLGDEEYWDCEILGKKNCHACLQCKNEHDEENNE